jgi:hypothetical protein
MIAEKKFAQPISFPNFIDISSDVSRDAAMTKSYLLVQELPTVQLSLRPRNLLL